MLSLLLLLCVTMAGAQSTDGTKYMLNATPLSLDLNSKKFYEKITLPAKKIVVQDYRFDTTKIGYVDPGFTVSGYNKVNHSGSWTPLLNQYFSGNLDPNSPNELLIIIRSFWMQDGFMDELSNKKIMKTEWMGRSDLKGGSCKAALDIFLYADSACMPLLKLEATFLNFRKFKAGNLDEWFFLPYDSMARNLSKKNIPPNWQKGKTIPLSVVQAAYAQRFGKPVLSQPGFEKGIYMTFADFCNNKITRTDFRFKAGKITDELYIGDEKNETLLTDYWGFYDGKQLYIRCGFNAFPAVRSNNTWEVFGAKHLSNIHNNAQPGDLIRVNSMDIFRKILQLNMETGEFY